jgi:hypothetical protein
VVPGSLVEHWQAEMADTFGLGFDILSRKQTRFLSTTALYRASAWRCVPADWKQNAKPRRIVISSSETKRAE